MAACTLPGWTRTDFTEKAERVFPNEMKPKSGFRVQLKRLLSTSKASRRQKDKHMTASSKIIVFSTAPKREEADRIAQILVEERLAACVNVMPNLRSFYRWEGRIVQDDEFLLLIKTEERFKLERGLSGIKSMDRLPGVVIVIDPNKEHIAVAEARKLQIPIVALTDTNCDPDGIDFVVPANDDALKNGVIASAALDVVEEDPIKPNNPLISLENITLTPHTAGRSPDTEMRGYRQVAEQVAKYLRGEKIHPMYVANKAVLNKSG